MGWQATRAASELILILLLAREGLIGSDYFSFVVLTEKSVKLSLTNKVSPFLRERFRES